MWVELICGLVIFRLLKRFFYDDDDDILDGETSSDATVLFTVADRLEKVYGGKAYVGLQIPDPDAATRTRRQNMDIVLVTKRCFAFSHQQPTPARYLCFAHSQYPPTTTTTITEF